MSDFPQAVLDAAALAQVRRMYRSNEAETDPRCLREAHAITDPIVEAAAPLIAAQALRDAADRWRHSEWSDVLLPWPESPANAAVSVANRVGNWIARADGIEGATRG